MRLLKKPYSHHTLTSCKNFLFRKRHFGDFLYLIWMRLFRYRVSVSTTSEPTREFWCWDRSSINRCDDIIDNILCDRKYEKYLFFQNIYLSKLEDIVYYKKSRNMPAALNSYMVLVITENVVSELVGKILYQFILTRYFGLPSKNV